MSNIILFPHPGSEILGRALPEPSSFGPGVPSQRTMESLRDLLNALHAAMQDLAQDLVKDEMLRR